MTTTCFVIGPIGDKLAPLGSEPRARWEEAIEVFEKVVLPACSQTDLEAVRADQIAVTGEINEQVFRHLYEDQIVIADLTGGNPNVMYELGLRHTRNLLTIQISEYGQLPFDIAGGRTILFSRSERGLVDARNALIRAINAGLAEGPDPITATRIWNSVAQDADVEAVQRLIELRDDDAPPEDLDSDGFLEKMVLYEEYMPKLNATVEAVGELLNVLGAESEESGRELNLINEAHQPAAVRLRFVTEFGKRLQARADELMVLADDFDASLQHIDSAVLAMLEFLREHPDRVQEDESSQAFLDSLVDLAKSSRSGFEELSNFANVVRDLGPTSKSLRKPAYQIADAVRRMARVAAVMDEWEAAANRMRLQQRRVSAGEPNQVT